MMGWIAVTLVGCAARESREDFSPPTDVAMVAAVRQQILQNDPYVIVGFVTQTLPRERFAAVGDVPLDQFRVGQIVTFMDIRQKPLTRGVIRRITSTELHVEYDKPPFGARAPRVGDLALRFTNPS
jgi:hypothetical protein